MSKIYTLIKEKIIVCPKTKRPLIWINQKLHNDIDSEYNIINEVPVFIESNMQTEYLSANSGAMKSEYSKFKKIKKRKTNDYASTNALNTQKHIFPKNSNEICISVGGGPNRIHPDILNLNIDLFENVDIVADAYALPFADNSVDSVYIGAVIEHLEFPDKAVMEIFRILKPGGKVYSDIPFIQRFHGYPNHFQNFTLIGHKRLFERNGFNIIESGVCVGPTYAMLEIINEYLIILFGKNIFGKILRRLLYYFGKVIRPFDKKINKKDNSYIIASTTFVLSEK